MTWLILAGYVGGAALTFLLLLAFLRWHPEGPSALGEEPDFWITIVVIFWPLALAIGPLCLVAMEVVGRAGRAVSTAIERNKQDRIRAGRVAEGRGDLPVVTEEPE